MSASRAAGFSTARGSAGVAALAAVVFLAALLRVLGWNNWSLWLDEAMTLDYVRRSLRGLWDILVLEGNHPPGHYLVTFAVRRISEADAALRLPSVFFAAGTVVALFVRCGGRRRAAVGLGAGFAFAVLPLAVHYGQEVRPYSMALCLVAVADAGRVTWRESRSRQRAGRLDRREHPRRVHALLRPRSDRDDDPGGGGRITWRVRREDPGRLRAPLAVGVLTLVLFLPWLWAIRNGLHQPPGEPPPFTASAVWTELVALAAGRDESLGPQRAAVFVWLVFGAGFLRASREGKWRLGLDLGAATVGVLALLALLPPLVERALSRPRPPPALARPRRSLRLVFGVERRWARALSSVVLAGSVGVAEAPALAENVRSGRADWRAAAAYLDRQSAVGRGGEILAADGWAYFCLRAQTTRLPEPRGVALADQPAMLQGQMAAASSGWVARAPHFGGGYPEVDALLAGTRPWVAVREADEVRLYRFEGGRLVPP